MVERIEASGGGVRNTGCIYGGYGPPRSTGVPIETYSSGEARIFSIHPFSRDRLIETWVRACVTCAHTSDRKHPTVSGRRNAV